MKSKSTASADEGWCPDESLPDQRSVLKYLLLSLGFGLVLGSVFPVYASLFVDFKSPLHEVIFIAGCIAAGLLVGFVSFLIGSFTVLRIIKDISGRLAVLSENEGDLSHDLAFRSSDVLGELVSNFNHFQAKLRRMVQAMAEVATKVHHSSRDLSESTEQSAASLEQMAATTAQVAKVAENQSAAASHSRHSVGEVLERIEKSDEMTRGMATQFFMFSQSMEANRRGIQAVATEARRSGDLAATLEKAGEAGGEVLNHLNATIQAVAEQAEQVQDIVQVILKIASQTNLLSMNAAIEAAHAGSSGSGFAVVASEIRALADTSSSQGKRIKQLLQGIAKAVETTLGQSEATRVKFQEIMGGIKLVLESGRAIAEQMQLQEVEDTRLSEGLVVFTKFYEQLSEAMDVQIRESQSVGEGVNSVEAASRQIRDSMSEQALGMEQATAAVVQVRETSLELKALAGDLQAQTNQFKTEC